MLFYIRRGVPNTLRQAFELAKNAGPIEEPAALPLPTFPAPIWNSGMTLNSGVGSSYEVVNSDPNGLMGSFDVDYMPGAGAENEMGCEVSMVVSDEEN
jgi:hypothetical protein